MKKTLAESIDALIQKEIAAISEQYETQIAELRTENQALKAKVAYDAMPKIDSSSLFNKLKQETIDSMVADMFPVSFYEHSYYSHDKAPTWFLLHVKYYNNRFDIYNLLDTIGIKYPDWAKKIILPHEWNRDQLVLFVKTLNHHYVCNGQIFEKNIDFWYNKQRDNLISPEKQMVGSSSDEIPWQFVLRNPLWNDDELIDMVATCIKKNESHSTFFYKLLEYNDKLTPKQVEKLLENINEDDFVRGFDSGKEIKLLLATGNDGIYKKIGHSKLTIPEDAPNAVRYYRIERLQFAEAVKYIHDCNFFNEQEKRDLLAKQMEKEYSDVAILDRLIQ